MAQIVWSPRAIKDIDEIADFIAKDSLQNARDQTKLFIEEARALVNHYYSCRVVPELDIGYL